MSGFEKWKRSKEALPWFNDLGDYYYRPEKNPLDEALARTAYEAGAREAEAISKRHVEVMASAAEGYREACDALAADVVRLLGGGLSPDIETGELTFGVGDVDVLAADYPAIAAALRQEGDDG